MLRSWSQVARLSANYNVPEEDVLLIALNALGVNSQLPHKRVRFNFAVASRAEDPLFLILAFGNPQSPFRHVDDQILFDGLAVGRILNWENDDAVQLYFRKNRKTITLNSNKRSSCTGCVFCPNTLEEKSDPKLRNRREMNAHFDLLCGDLGMRDLAHIEKVTVCTGCFHHEHLAIDHMAMVRLASADHNFAGELQLLSSVVRSRQGFARLAELSAPFHITFTVECFTNRAAILKKSKADFAFEDMLESFSAARTYGHNVDFCYIVGLDPLDVAVEGVKRLARDTTTFPRLQVFQAHNLYMQQYLTPGARSIEYYLDARRELERVFDDKSLAPQSWENYRPLWYFAYAGREMSGIRT